MPASYHTSFGFQPLLNDQPRQSLVNDVFTRVAGNYDRMNDVMSLGMHRLWKQEFVRQVRLRPHERLLDVAGGTGDIALAARSLPERPVTGQITLCDISPAMLAEGRKRLWDAGYGAEMHCIAGNAEALPFGAGSYDVVTIAFGLRNVSHIEAALASMRRVLRPGGRFFCLEFSQPASAWLRQAYDAYSFRVIPWLGERIAQDRAAYQYLVESIRRFPAAERLRGLMQEAGFHRPEYRRLSNGIVAVHWGWAV